MPNMPRVLAQSLAAWLGACRFPPASDRSPRRHWGICGQAWNRL